MDTPNPYLNYTLAGEPVALFGMFLITTVLMAYVTLSGPSKSEESEETDETQKESESAIVPGVGMMPTVVDTEEAPPEEPEAESEEKPEVESEEKPEAESEEKPEAESEEKPAETVTEPKGGKGWFASVFQSKKDGKKRKSTKHLRKKHNAKTKRRTKGIRTPKLKR